MTDDEIRVLAVDTVKGHYKNEPHIRNIKALEIVPRFLMGCLVFVEFKDTESEELDTNYVYIDSVNHRPIFMEDAKEISLIVSGTKPHRVYFSQISMEFLRIGGISGIIAILITAAICYMSFMGKDLPSELIGILATIVGYYFGAMRDTGHKPSLSA